MAGIFAMPQDETQEPPIEEDPPMINIEALPMITVRKEDRSLYSIPQIAITFPDGHEDELILEKHFPNEQARMENEEHCNYFGHLKNDPQACVAVTGCYGRDKLDFTIMSDHSLYQNMFVLEKDGQLKAVKRQMVKSGVIESQMESRQSVGKRLLYQI